MSRWYRDEACNSCKCAMAVEVEGLLFKPIESVSEKFLLTITSLKRVGDLKALSVAPSCLKFASGMVKAFIHPKTVYEHNQLEVWRLPRPCYQGFPFKNCVIRQDDLFHTHL